MFAPGPLVWIVAIPLAVALLGVVREARAGGPMDLARRDARWVTVQVVTSIPGDPAVRLSAPALAWFEAEPGTDVRRVTVPAASVERLFFADRRPVANSFTDFVWTFDARTGHVTSASLSGSVRERIALGPFHPSVEVRIRIDLSTLAPGGYRPPRELAGRTIVGFCRERRPGDCTLVSSVGYDAGTGWVQANGPVCAVWRSLETRAFTRMGRARFRELDPLPHDRPAAWRALEASTRSASDAPAC